MNIKAITAVSGKSLLLIFSCFILLSPTFYANSATSAGRKTSDPVVIKSLDDTTLVSIAYNPYVMNYSDEDEVYDLVKQALEQLNPGDPLNPLSNLIEPGDVVALKPNLVGAQRIAFEGCTRASVLRPIIDQAVKAGASEVVIAEGPAYPDWDDEVFYSANITDLVNEMQIKYPGVPISFQNLNKDNWTWVDLGSYSTFHGVYTAQDLYSLREIRMDQNSYYYATDSKGYNPKGYTPGLYAIANTILEADVLINVPKMKVHRITGVTMSLKNFIGITVSDTGNTTNQESIKDIPHWNTSYPHGGEEKERIDTFENDVIWRVTADLHKTALYADKDGNLQSTKQRKYLSVMDGIIGMEGPLIYDDTPDPRPTGTIVVGQDPVAVDIVGSRVMGFNYTVLYALTNMNKVSDHLFGSADPTKICVLGTSLTGETFGESYVPQINYEDDRISPYKIRLQNFDPPKAELIKTDPENPVEGVEIKVVVNTTDIDVVAAGWLYYSIDSAEPEIMKMIPNGELGIMIANLGFLEGGTSVECYVCLQDYFLNTEWREKISISIAHASEVMITSFYVTRNSFSPNSDDKKDVTIIRAWFTTEPNMQPIPTSEVEWTLRVKTPITTTVRTWVGTGGVVNVMWNGTDDAGDVLPDSEYYIILQGRDEDGNLTTLQSRLVILDTAKPTITDVSDFPDPFNPYIGETATISYTLSEECRVTIEIFDYWGTTVKLLRASQPAGANSMTWDGTLGNQDIIVSGGTFTYEIHATDMAGNEAMAIGTTTMPSTVNLRSKEDDGSSYNKGEILFDGKSYELPETIIVDAGTYSVSYVSKAGYEFVRWETFGGVSVSDPNSQSTTVTVSNPGWLRAVYRKSP